jgi:anthranilate phosphoribosyltransferase
MLDIFYCLNIQKKSTTSSFDNLLKNPEKTITSIIKRVATGPELSKSISYKESRASMRLVLEGLADPVQAAMFLIGLRMMRETDDEYKRILQDIRNKTKTVVADVDELVDIADPYNVYGRSLPSSPCLPLLFAESGVPAVSHEVETVGPKFGVTHHQILQAAGVSVELTGEEAGKQISNP